MKPNQIMLALVLAAPISCYEGVSTSPSGATGTIQGPEDSSDTRSDPETDEPGRDPAPPSTPDDGPASGGPELEGEGDAEHPLGRHLKRMSASQFHASLITVTGQPWADYETYAGAMGRADFAEITEDGRELSVTFDRFAHDAAAASCSAAVLADRSDPSRQVILRETTLNDTDADSIRENLDYLMLRFLGQNMAPDDPRTTPWMGLLWSESEDEAPSEDDMQERWIAVCIGLVTHPDFITY